MCNMMFLVHPHSLFHIQIIKEQFISYINMSNYIFIIIFLFLAGFENSCFPLQSVYGSGAWIK